MKYDVLIRRLPAVVLAGCMLAIVCLCSCSPAKTEKGSGNEDSREQTSFVGAQMSGTYYLSRYRRLAYPKSMQGERAKYEYSPNITFDDNLPDKALVRVYGNDKKEMQVDLIDKRPVGCAFYDAGADLVFYARGKNIYQANADGSKETLLYTAPADVTDMSGGAICFYFLAENTIFRLYVPDKKADRLFTPNLPVRRIRGINNLIVEWCALEEGRPFEEERYFFYQEWDPQGDNETFTHRVWEMKDTPDPISAYGKAYDRPWMNYGSVEESSYQALDDEDQLLVDEIADFLLNYRF